MSDQIEPTNEVVDSKPAETTDTPVFDKESLKQKIKDSVMGVKPDDAVVTESEDIDNNSEEEPVNQSDEVSEETNEEEVEVRETEEESEGEESTEDELDLDSDPEQNEKSEEEESTEDDLDKNIVALRKKHTELNEKYQSQEETLNKTIDELEKTKDELEKYTLTQIDPKSHPDFLNKSEATANSIYSGLVRLKGLPDAADKLGERWGDILTDVDSYESTPRSEKARALSDLRLSIANRLGMVEGDVDTLDPSVDGEAIDAADKVIDVFERHTSNYKELGEIYSRIQTKAADKSLEIGYEEYNSNTEPVRQSLAMIDSMSDKDIDEDPTSIQALAAKKISSSPELRSRSTKIDKLLVEMAFGPEALSQEELDRHLKSGKDMNEFHKSRNDRVTNIRNKYLPQMKSLLVLLPQIKKALPEFFDTESKAAKVKSQKQAVRKTTSKQPVEKIDKKDQLLTKEDLRSNMRKSLRM